LGYAAVAVAVAVGAVAIGIGVWKSASVSGAVPVVEPVTTQLDVLARNRVFFGHQSVGANTLEGLIALTAGRLTVMETTAASDIAAGTVAHAYVGTNGDPQSKIDAFSDIVDAGVGDVVDVAILKLCYTDVTAGSDAAAIAGAYIDALDALRAKHPDVAFIAATVPLMTEPDWIDGVKGMVGRGDGRTAEDNLVRAEFNQVLRDRYDRPGTLFDIAAVESMFGETVHRKDGVEYHALSPAYASDHGHLNAMGAHAAASEFVRVVAQGIAEP